MPRIHFPRHSPIRCIIPEHILTGLIKHGTSEQREFALISLQLDHSFRSARLGFVEFNRPRFAARRMQRVVGRPAWLGAVIQPQPDRTIYTAHETQRIPGQKRRGEGDPPTGDAEVDEAYDGLGATFNLYWQAYERNSIDDRGLPLNGTVHYGVNYDNAFWDGQRMNFGDGDQVTFNRFTVAVDIMGHELTHGVTQHESNLIYWGQTGALNESISDVFGSLVKQFHNNEAANQADWIIGEGLLAGGINGVGIRSMKAPGTAYDDPAMGGKDPQPAHMKDYVYTFQDNAGVHINSGIPNYAFYLTAVSMGGNAWEKAGSIWYQSCISPFMKPTMRFQPFAQLTVSTAQQLFGPGSAEVGAVQNAWNAVGIGV